MAKEPPKIRKISMDPDNLARAAARGEKWIRKGSWSVQGVERRVKSLELMIEGWRDPNIKFHKTKYEDIDPGKVRITAGARTNNPLRQATKEQIEDLEVGVRNLRKLLDDLRLLVEIIPTPTLKASVKAGGLELKNPPSGWSSKKVDSHERKVREKLAEIDFAIQNLNHLQDLIPQQAARKAVSAGGIARAEKTRTRNEKIVQLRGEGKTYPQISGILASDAIASIFAEAKKGNLSDGEADKRIAEEEGNRMSPDAVRKVCERRSKK